MIFKKELAKIQFSKQEDYRNHVESSVVSNRYIKNNGRRSARYFYLAKISMKEMFEEYGGTAAATITASAIIGMLLALFIPGTPFHDAVVNFLTASMPF